MRTVKLLGFTALALLAFGAFTASAFAVEDGKPQILCLVAGCETLEGTLKGGASRIEDLAGKTIAATASEAKLKGCKNDEAGTKDVNLCVDVPLALTGFKKEAVACRSENAKGEKDAVETVLTLLDLHMAAEETSAKVLQPLLTAQYLGTALEAEVTIVCGVVKSKVKGVLACLLLPGLANVQITEKVTINCEVNITTHDPVTGTCTVLCEDLGKIGLIATFDGKTETDAWENIRLEGSLNKDIFIDD
jgi:hypothetical protein